MNRQRRRLLLCTLLVLLVPVVPFVLFGRQVESTIERYLAPPPAPATVAAATIAVLSADILLPVPSSFVNTLAGAQLGVVGGAAAAWLGMTLGAVLGFALARSFGKPLALRFSSAEDLERLGAWGDRWAMLLVVAARALPILAEASVLLVGVGQMPWRHFLPAVALSNLGIAVVYAALGRLASSQHQLPLVLAASIGVPLAAAVLVRGLLIRAAPAEPPVYN